MWFKQHDIIWRTIGSTHSVTFSSNLFGEHPNLFAVSGNPGNSLLGWMQKLHRVIRKPFLWREKLEIGQVEQEEEEGGFWCGVTSNTCGKVAACLSSSHSRLLVILGMYQSHRHFGFLFSSLIGAIGNLVLPNEYLDAAYGLWAKGYVPNSGSCHPWDVPKPSSPSLLYSYLIGTKRSTLWTRRDKVTNSGTLQPLSLS